MERRARFLAAACAACLLCEGVALAAEPDDAPSASSAASSNPEERAAAAFQRAMAAYEAGELPSALADMRESLRLSGRTELLYNIARLEDELGLCADALADYRDYLARAPQGRYRVEAEGALQALLERCPPEAAAGPPAITEETPRASAQAAAQEQGGAPRPLPPPPLRAGTSNGWPPPALGYGAMALGVVAEASAIYFLNRAVDARDRLQRSVDRAESGGPRADLSLRTEQHRNQRWAQVLAVSGGVLLAGGVVLVIAAPRKNSQATATTRLLVAPSQLTVVRDF